MDPIYIYNLPRAGTLPGKIRVKKADWPQCIITIFPNARKQRKYRNLHLIDGQRTFSLVSSQPRSQGRLRLLRSLQRMRRHVMPGVFADPMDRSNSGIIRHREEHGAICCAICWTRRPRPGPCAAVGANEAAWDQIGRQDRCAT